MCRNEPPGALKLRRRVACLARLDTPLAHGRAALFKFSKILGPRLRTCCGEGNRSRADGTEDYVETSGKGWEPVLRSNQETGLGLLQAGGATDEASDFRQ
jgi:hypothetical protein